MTRLIIVAALALFGYESIAVLREHGYGGFLDLARANSATNLLLLDVTIFIVLASIWILRDARPRMLGVPFVLLAAVFGAAGPLAYLLARPWLTPATPAASEARHA